MNKMKEVAQLLGVEIGEEFGVKGKAFNYHLGNESLFDEQGNSYPALLVNLINGKTEIVKLPFKPKNGEIYWTPYNNNKGFFSGDDIWVGKSSDYLRYHNGLVFKTSTESDMVGIPRLKEIIEECEK